MTNCTLCDTLVSDDGTADECLTCGATYDMGRLRGLHVFIPPTPPVAVVSTARPSTFKSRGVKVRSINGFRR